MRVCEAGSYRDNDYEHTLECVDCPRGRYREFERGRYADDTRDALRSGWPPRGGYGVVPSSSTREIFRHDTTRHATPPPSHVSLSDTT